MKNKLKPVVKCFGGKYYQVDHILSHFPLNYQELTFISPFVGGGSLEINKLTSKIDIINDLCFGLMCIYEIIKTNCNCFIEILQSLEYNEKTFQSALYCEIEHEDILGNAVNEYILRRMSRSGLKKNFSWSNRMRGGQFGDVNAWQNSIKQLQAISEKIHNYFILCQDFRETLMNLNDKCFVYCDSPYLPCTRTAKKAYGPYEMSIEDHQDLLYIIRASKAKILISGYNSDLYNHHLQSWNKVEKEIVNHSGQNVKKAMRTEILWKNF